MNTYCLRLALIPLFCLLSFAAFAQPSRDSIVVALKSPTVRKKVYLSNALDGGIFSLAKIDKSGADARSILRFSYVINYGALVNFDPSRYFGLFTGLGIKNIGFIERDGDSTIKRRVYTIGAPLGIKFGDLVKKKYGFLGGGIDFPFNYKEKGFVRRKDKTKFNEFFSDRTQDFMPYVFAGIAGPTLSLKLQYYPDNFFNTSYEDKGLPMVNGAYQRPYAAYNVNLFLLSVGVNLTYNRVKEGRTRRVRIRAPRQTT